MCWGFPSFPLFFSEVLSYIVRQISTWMFWSFVQRTWTKPDTRQTRKQFRECPLFVSCILELSSFLGFLQICPNLNMAQNDYKMTQDNFFPLILLLDVLQFHSGYTFQ